MISICIPIYNYDVRELVTRLSILSGKIEVPTELILIDDGSNPHYKKLNEDLCSNEKYIQLEKNIGRAAIRNRFAQYAKYPNLLFLDCDSIINSDKFLINYVDAIKNQPESVLCGGSEYAEHMPDKSQKLRWKYGVKKESKNAIERNKHAYKSFLTNNVLIPLAVFKQVTFDENLSEYGHEDTLFGFNLELQGIEVSHIQNPVLNGGLENNKQYLANTEKAVKNLVYILQQLDFDKSFIEEVKLLRTYYKLYPFRHIIIVLFLTVKPLAKLLLGNGYSNLKLFNFYKLGTFSLAMQKSSN